jgi:hypothetical protein
MSTTIMAPSLEDLSTLQIMMDTTFYGCFTMLFTISNVVLNNRCRVIEIQNIQHAERDSNSTLGARLTELRFWKLLGSVFAVLITGVSRLVYWDTN